MAGLLQLRDAKLSGDIRIPFIYGHCPNLWHSQDSERWDWPQYHFIRRATIPVPPHGSTPHFQEAAKMGILLNREKGKQPSTAAVGHLKRRP